MPSFPWLLIFDLLCDRNARSPLGLIKSVSEKSGRLSSFSNPGAVFGFSLSTLRMSLLSGVEFEDLPRHRKQLVPHAPEGAEVEHHVNQAAIFGVDRQFVDRAQILILAINHRPGSGRLWAPKGPASTTSILRHRRRAQATRVLSGWFPCDHHLSRLDWKADCPLTSLAFIWKLATDARTEHIHQYF